MRVELLMALCAAAGPSERRHPFAVQDLLAIAQVSDPHPSPDGANVVFVVSRADVQDNRRRTDIWLVATEGGAPRQLTMHPSGSDSSPRWAEDGRTVFFLSSRSGTRQVWRIGLERGAAEPVTKFGLDVNAFALSPDGRTLVASIDVFVDCRDLACSRRRLEETLARKASGRVYDELFVRHWDEWSDLRRSHLFALPSGGGDPRDLMRGMRTDAPSKPFGRDDEWAFTPDGTALLFSARAEPTSEAWSTNLDLFSVPLDASAPPRRLTANPASDEFPAFSPDGRTLAYLAQQRPGYEADRYRVVLRDWQSGTERVLTGRWDRSPQRPVWSSDGRALLVVADDGGERPLFAIDAGTGEVRKLVPAGASGEPATAQGKVFFTLEDLRTPAEVHCIDGDGTRLRRLTHLNDALLSTVEMGEVAAFTFKGWNDEPVRALLVKPAPFDPSRRYPVTLVIHGGPQSSYSNEFHHRWNLEDFAGAGFAVLEVELHGSTGYGQAFTDSIRGDRGGKPLADLKLGLAAALQRNPWMDGRRVCALGASYGGYLVNWIAGAWPDRFRCLVTHNGDFDERAAYFNTEELWRLEHDYQGTPWTNPAAYERHNPVTLVKSWKTPMLVVQGGRDFRVVDTQGLSTFTALQRRGIPSRLLYFPDECHWISQPQNCVLWHDTVIAWLKKWTAP